MVSNTANRAESYLGKTFLVVDADARIRSAANLIAYERYGVGDQLPFGAKIGDFRRIAPNTPVIVDDIEVVSTGSDGSIVFAHALSADAEEVFGWTSTRNMQGKFVNETIGEASPSTGADKFGPNAAWRSGVYIGQKALISIVDAKLEIERIAVDTIDAYFQLVAAARTDGIQLAINSGFRSWPEQKYLYDGYVSHRPGFNLTAKPGWSNHQSGVAFDFAVGGGPGDPIYDWLAAHATSFGFVRTVDGEPWHWEHDPAEAAIAAAHGTHKTPNVGS